MSLSEMILEIFLNPSLSPPYWETDRQTDFNSTFQLMQKYTKKIMHSIYVAVNETALGRQHCEVR